MRYSAFLRGVFGGCLLAALAGATTLQSVSNPNLWFSFTETNQPAQVDQITFQDWLPNTKLADIQFYSPTEMKLVMWTDYDPSQNNQIDEGPEAVTIPYKADDSVWLLDVVPNGPIGSYDAPEELVDPPSTILASPVPEPRWLIIAGIGLLALIMKRKLITT